MMRILLTADPDLPVPPIGYGGIERIVDGLVRGYAARGHTVGLVAHAESRSPAAVRFAWPGRRAASFADSVRNSLALRRAVAAFQPDVLHSFSRLAYLAPLLHRRLPKLMSYQRHAGGRQISLALRLAGDSLQFSGCSEFICRMGRPAGGTWSAIPNFVETDRYDFTPSVPADAPLVFLGRIESIKGADLAIAMARAAGRRLILAGNRAERGPEREFWERRIAPYLGREGIEWIGEVDDGQKNQLLGGAAALLAPIQWDEPFGIVFAEALACGTPLLTCRRGATPEIVDEGRTGFFVTNVADGVAALRRLGELDRAACRRAAETRFSRDVCTGQYLARFEALRAAHP